MTHADGRTADRDQSVDLSSLVREAALRLAAAGVESGAHDARALAGHVLVMDPARLSLVPAVTPEQATAIQQLVDQRSARVPLQHLTGVAYFRRLKLAVGPGVFIPRPETELVVEAALAEVNRLVEAGVGRPRLVDLCTGSGAIAAAVAQEAPKAQVFAVELSPEAYAWAERNLRDTGVDLRLADARQALPELDGSVDVVVSNPPYIPAGARIRDPEVAQHDPAIALWGGGADGLDVMRAIVTRAGELLRPGGFVVLEHADVQGSQLVTVLERESGFVEVADHRDLAGRDRFTTARRSIAAGAEGAAGSLP
jgi:release factor glutamine methyltransferase